ncbi:MAG: hypothetical protein CL928_14585, partial [Deltaproteobacteria bacterium]|nr:hypothetical protein [Deltaproteobacteria bacterium]
GDDDTGDDDTGDDDTGDDDDSAGSSSLGTSYTDALMTHRVHQYGKFELQFPYDHDSSLNPYDSDDVQLTFTFEDPDGLTQDIDGFYFQDHDTNCGGLCESGYMPTVGDPQWMVRYAPHKVGTYTFTSTLTDNVGTVAGPSGSFESIPSEDPGFVRIAADKRHFVFDDGSDYFPVGMNTAWGSGSEGIIDMYPRMFGEMKAEQMNYGRLWMVEWSFGLELDTLGEYRSPGAWLVDYVLDWAEQNGIYLMLALDTYSHLEGGGWSVNPYNSARGGPCASPTDFWTDTTAKDYYKQRLRYLVSRWGHATHLLSWQFFNEVDMIDTVGYDTAVQADVTDWHEEMGDHLHAIDPNSHLVTTSFAWATVGAPPWGGPEVWALDAMDYSMTHLYGVADFASQMATYSDQQKANADKPHYFGEFGANGSTGVATYSDDPNGLALHNGIWVSPFIGNAGTAMAWFWQDYIDTYDLYFEFGDLSAFLHNIPLANQGRAEAPVSNVGAGVNVYGQSNDEGGLLWVQNDASTWCCPYRSSGYVPSADDVSFDLGGVLDGNYIIRWWDDGAIFATETGTASSGSITLAQPGLSSDWALRVDLDLDADAMPDSWESGHGLSLSVDDSASDDDSDGLTNLQEFMEATSPALADTDGDGIDDGAEVAAGTSPSDPDTDGDGMPDGWEADYGLDSLDRADGDTDADSDGLSNREEFKRTTDPTDSDTDGDGALDGAEVSAGSDPLSL